VTAEDSWREDLKNEVKEHWEREPCGTRYGGSDDPEKYFDEIYRSRYGRTGYLRDSPGSMRLAASASWKSASAPAATFGAGWRTGRVSPAST